MTRQCPNCNQPERVNEIGISNLAPYSGFCTDCINAGLQEVSREEDRRHRNVRTPRAKVELQAYWAELCCMIDREPVNMPQTMPELRRQIADMKNQLGDDTPEFDDWTMRTWAEPAGVS